MLVVLDTSVLVSALRSRLGASYALLQILDEERYRIAASPPLFLEYEQVLHRSEHHVPAEQVEDLLRNLAAIVVPVEIRYLWRPQLPDPDDEMVLEAAVNGHAEAIVTHNRRDFEAAAQRFGILVWSPAEFLGILKKEG